VAHLRRSRAVQADHHGQGGDHGAQDLRVDRPSAGIFVALDLTAALAAGAAFNAVSGEREIMVIGGGEIYRQALPLAERIYLSEVQAEPPGDAFFPELPEGVWHEVEREDHDGREANADHPYSFVVLERILRSSG
jgi:dihydrofolate reductase